MSCAVYVGVEGAFSRGVAVLTAKHLATQDQQGRSLRQPRRPALTPPFPQRRLNNTEAPGRGSLRGFPAIGLGIEPRAWGAWPIRGDRAGALSSELKHVAGRKVPRRGRDAETDYSMSDAPAEPVGYYEPAQVSYEAPHPPTDIPRGPTPGRFKAMTTPLNITLTAIPFCPIA